MIIEPANPISINIAHEKIRNYTQTLRIEKLYEYKLDLSEKVDANNKDSNSNDSWNKEKR